VKTKQYLNALAEYLKERHARIMDLETEAMRFLKSGDTKSYADNMRAKAELLSGIGEEAQDLLAPLPGELRFNLALALDRFASGARNALSLNSVFYMSALLYPDDQKQGIPDNLMACISRIEQEGENFSPT
jgi:hypothetical protein